jgi:hypothetical protein
MSLKGNQMCTAFKEDLLEGYFSGITIKLALYTSDADLSAATTAYTTTGEVTDAGYTAGGVELTPSAAASSGTTAYLDFDDVSIAGAITAAGGLIYNATTGAAICVLSFGRDITSTTSFDITFPTADALNAIVRIK